jgi:hypothetical protein
MISSRTFTKSDFPSVFFPARQSIELMLWKLHAMPPYTRVPRGVVGLFFWLPGLVIDSWNRAPFVDSSSYVVRSGGGQRPPVLQPRRLAKQRRRLLLQHPRPPRWTPSRRWVHLHPPAHVGASPSPKVHLLSLHPQAQGRCPHIYLLKRISNLALKKKGYYDTSKRGT